MKKILLLAGLFSYCFLSNAQETATNKDTVKVDAGLTTATVYFGYGAELNHQTKLKVDAGTKIIVINGLSTTVDPNSLQISCPEDVALLSQRFSLYTPPLEAVVKNRDVEKLEDSIIHLQKEIQRINNMILIETQILQKTGNLIETTIGTSGNKTVTSEEVVKLVEYYSNRIDKSNTNIFNHQQNITVHNKRIDEWRRKINQLTVLPGASPRPIGQVTMQVMCKFSQEIPVNLSYYTRNAGWTALYDVRVNSKTNKVKMVYKATMTQTSGLDWKKTKLTLSTGTPNFGIVAPLLTAWYLQLYVPGIYTDLQRRAAQGNAARNSIQSYENDDALAEVIVTDAKGITRQKRALDTTIDPSTIQQYTTLNEGQLNTNFEIDLPYDIQGNGELHSVTIKEQTIDCNLKNYAVPRVDKDAYLLAEIADWQNLDLLPGEANIVMDDTYIGKSVMDPNTTADTLNLSLGRDRRIAVKRSVVKELSSLKTSGGVSKQVFTYEIIVKNNKVSDVNLLLKDQYPLSTIKEVTVSLDEKGEAMVNEETGVLTWKLDLKPGESKKVRFTYTVKYPKDKKIVNLK